MNAEESKRSDLNEIAPAKRLFRSTETTASSNRGVPFCNSVLNGFPQTLESLERPTSDPAELPYDREFWRSNPLRLCSHPALAAVRKPPGKVLRRLRCPMRLA